MTHLQAHAPDDADHIVEQLAAASTDARSPRRWLAQLIAGSPSGILMLGPGGDVIVANQAAGDLLNVDPRALSGRSFGLPLVPERVTEVQLAGGPEGPRVVELSATPLDDGQPGQLVFLRDVTVVQTLERTFQDMEMVMRALGHDLREPLRMVTSYLDLFEKRGGSEGLDEDLAEFLATARQGAGRLSRMLDALLAYAKAGGGASDPVDAGHALIEAEANLARQIEAAGAEIDADDLPNVQFDPDQLVLVFQNLISNAIRYAAADRPPRIHVTARTEGVATTLLVEDNGQGIPEAQQDLVFDLFHRVDGRPAEGADAAGVGLAICRRIVEHHGGKIWVDSEPGRGSTFCLELRLPDKSGRGGGSEERSCSRLTRLQF